MKHEDKIELARGAQKRVTNQFMRLAEDPVVKESMREAAERLRNMRMPNQPKRA